MPLIPLALKHGAIPGCAGDGYFSTATREYFAEAAAAVLSTPGQAGRVYELAGDESYTWADFVAAVSATVGIPVVIRTCPRLTTSRCSLASICGCRQRRVER